MVKTFSVADSLLQMNFFMTLQIYRSLSDATFLAAASRAEQSEADDVAPYQEAGYLRTGLRQRLAAE
jgi:hypothetical protein